ncbi:flagellar hook-length control protein FliK [Allorhizobium pseudoryzae]|uniref:flagellar hook-length control protein FliK n=1 Tax=Allorhizobium pseudoryzae TaxID=379684 RepID=UPI003CFE1432
MSDVSQPSRASASRNGKGGSGEFGEALSAIAQDERPSRDGSQPAEKGVATEDDAAAESAGSRTTSRLALSFLQKTGEAASAQAKAEGSPSAATLVALSGQKAEVQAGSVKGSELQAGLKTNAMPEGLVELPGTKGEVKGTQGVAGAGVTSDGPSKGALVSNGNVPIRKVVDLAQDGKLHGGKEATNSKARALDTDPDAVAGQAADAVRDAGRPGTDMQVTTEGDLQTSAQAVATLLSGLVAADGVQPQPKSAARGDSLSSKPETDGKVLLDPTALDGSDLLETALSKDAVNKTMLEQSATADETEKRAFRLTSARDGRSLDMTIGTDQNGKATVDTSTKTSGAETVSVLDSRRFLGFSQSTNGAALTSTIAGDSQWQRAMQPGAALQNEQARTSNVVNTLKLQMTPIDLGTVTATLRLVGEELSVHLTVETRAAHQQLSDDSSGILGALRAQGFSVDQVTVTMSSQDSNAQMSSDGQQRSPDANGQQGNAQSQGQSSGRSEASVKHGSNETEAGTETRSHSSGGAGGTSDIYL